MENIIKDFYRHYDEDKRLTSKSHLPEYLTTMRYIKKYLKPDMKILEIGAGTGRYSLALADMGYSVDAVELVPHNIKIMKSKVKASHNINIYEGNACDLSFLENNTYDIVLLLGPMYHLFTDEDKHKAINEAVRVAKCGAVIFAAYCNNDTSMLKLFERHTFIEYKSQCHIDDNFHANSVPELIFELYRREDIDRIMSGFKVTRLHYVGVDMLSYFFKDSLDEMTDEEFDLYMKYHYSVCERIDFSGLSFHMLDIFRKE